MSAGCGDVIGDVPLGMAPYWCIARIEHVMPARVWITLYDALCHGPSVHHTDCQKHMRGQYLAAMH